MSYSGTKTPRESLAEFVRQETDGGREIMQFFLDVFRGRFEDAKMCHRVAAARELAKYGCEEAQEFLKAVANSRNGRAPSPGTAESPPKDDLADFIKLETDDGKEVIRFYLDVLRNRIEDARMRHRISVGKELLKRGFDIVPVRTDEDYQDEDNKECRNKSCYHWQYAVKRWHIDSHNRKALEQLYGSEEAASVAIRAVIELRQNTVRLHSHVPDHDFTPIENPEDDPDGKGSYGYEILFASFGDNQAVRVANRAVEKYKKQLAKDSPVGAGFKPDLDPAQPSAKHNSGSPQDSHAYADSNPGPVSEHPQDPSVEEDLGPSRDPEIPPLPAGEGWSLPRARNGGEGETPTGGRPSDPSFPTNSRVTHNPSPSEDSKPVRGYAHCNDCASSVGEGSKPSRDHPSVILSEAEGSPALKPPPRRPRLPIYLGPPSEDTDEDSEAKDIRVPLKDVRSTSYVHF